MVQRYDIERYYGEAHWLVRQIEERRIRTIMGFAAVSQGDRLLEVGCGAGHVLVRFPHVDRTGVDLSTTMLGWARRRLGNNVTLVLASGDQLPFPEAAFDVVVCTEVLEHTRDPAAVLREMVRVSAPGARIVVSVPNERQIDGIKRVLNRVPGLRWFRRNLSEEQNEWHLHRMDLAFLRRLCKGTARLERIRAVPIPLVPIRYVALLRSPA